MARKNVNSVPLKKNLYKNLSPAQLCYLQDAPGDDLDGLDSIELFDLRTGAYPARKIWEEHRDAFLPEFIQRNPGQRPAGWWAWDCPRQADKDIDCFWHGTLPEERLWASGGGFEVNGVPHYARGVPSYAEYDEADPPMFESQASFLRRWNLLTSAELKKLKAEDYDKTESIEDILA